MEISSTQMLTKKGSCKQRLIDYIIYMMGSIAWRGG